MSWERGTSEIRDFKLQGWLRAGWEVTENVAQENTMIGSQNDNYLPKTQRKCLIEITH